MLYFGNIYIFHVARETAHAKYAPILELTERIVASAPRLSACRAAGGLLTRFSGFRSEIGVPRRGMKNQIRTRVWRPLFSSCAVSLAGIRLPPNFSIPPSPLLPSSPTAWTSPSFLHLSPPDVEQEPRAEATRYQLYQGTRY